MASAAAFPPLPPIMYSMLYSLVTMLVGVSDTAMRIERGAPVDDAVDLGSASARAQDRAALEVDLLNALPVEHHRPERTRVSGS